MSPRGVIDPDTLRETQTRFSRAIVQVYRARDVILIYLCTYFEMYNRSQVVFPGFSGHPVLGLALGMRIPDAAVVSAARLSFASRFPTDRNESHKSRCQIAVARRPFALPSRCPPRRSLSRLRRAALRHVLASSTRGFPSRC